MDAQAIEFLREIGQAERHFNSLQMRYRLLASTWLLAAFAALSFLLKPNDEGPILPVAADAVALVVSVGAAAAVGIMLLWFLDVAVYHTLLMNYHKQGKKVENDYDLPGVRTEGDSSRASLYATLFYTVLAAAALGVAEVLALTANTFNTSLVFWVLNGAVLAGAVTLNVCMSRSGGTPTADAQDAKPVEEGHFNLVMQKPASGVPMELKLTVSFK